MELFQKTGTFQLMDHRTVLTGRFLFTLINLFNNMFLGFSKLAYHRIFMGRDSDCTLQKGPCYTYLLIVTSLCLPPWPLPATSSMHRAQ